MDVVVIDGMDVMAVREASHAAVEHARSGKGPAFIEAKTFRFQGHSMADPAKYRSPAEHEVWKARDPIPNFGRRLVAEEVAGQDQLDRITEKARSLVAEAVQFAEESPWPADREVYEDIYV